jgi:hypothetical protein
MSHLDDIATWIRAHLDTQGDTPTADAHRLILTIRDNRATQARRPGATPDAHLVADQWTDAMLILADAARQSGVPGWREEWTRAYEEHVGVL